MTDPNVLVEQSRWILSSCAQVFASLAALTGVFGVFRLQLISSQTDALLAELVRLCDSTPVHFLQEHSPDIAGDKPLLDSNAVADLVAHGIASSIALRRIRDTVHAIEQSGAANTTLRRQAEWVRYQFDVILSRAARQEISHRAVQSAVIESLVVGSAMVALSLVALAVAALSTPTQTWIVTLASLAFAMVALAWITLRCSSIIRK